MKLTLSDLAFKVRQYLDAHGGPLMDDAKTRLAVKAVCESLAEAMTAGDEVVISNFGTFFTKKLQPTQKRNFRTGEVFTTQGNYVARFKAATKLRNALRDKG